MEVALRHIILQDWISLVIFISLGLLAIAKYFHNARFLDFMLILQSDKYLISGNRESNFWHPFNMLLTSVQICSTSLFVFLLFCFIQELEAPQQPFLFIEFLIGYLILLSAKAIIEHITSWTLSLQTEFSAYFLKKITYRNFFSLFLLVISCFLVYSKAPPNILIYIIIGVTCLLLLLFSINFIGKYRDQIIAHPFYFILYFCALEIAPYYILYKVVTK